MCMAALNPFVDSATSRVHWRVCQKRLSTYLAYTVLAKALINGEDVACESVVGRLAGYAGCGAGASLFFFLHGILCLLSLLVMVIDDA